MAHSQTRIEPIFGTVRLWVLLLTRPTNHMHTYICITICIGSCMSYTVQCSSLWSLDSASLPNVWKRQGDQNVLPSNNDDIRTLLGTLFWRCFLKFILDPQVRQPNGHQIHPASHPLEKRGQLRDHWSLPTMFDFYFSIANLAT